MTRLLALIDEEDPVEASRVREHPSIARTELALRSFSDFQSH